MAVVAVGDFSAADIESKIKLEFESMKNPARERERKPIILKWGDKNTFKRLSASLSATPSTPRSSAT